MGVANGICAVTVSKGETLDILFGKIDGELKNLADETVDKYSGEVADRVTKRLDRTMAAVPCGLPVMPPHWILRLISGPMRLWGSIKLLLLLITTMR